MVQLDILAAATITPIRCFKFYKKQETLTGTLIHLKIGACKNDAQLKDQK